MRIAPTAQGGYLIAQGKFLASPRAPDSGRERSRNYASLAQNGLGAGSDSTAPWLCHFPQVT